MAYVVKTSTRLHNCGTHSIGIFIYSKWSKLSAETQQAVLNILHQFYQLPESFNQADFQALFSKFSSNDIQIIIGLCFLFNKKLNFNNFYRLKMHFLRK